MAFFAQKGQRSTILPRTDRPSCGGDQRYYAADCPLGAIIVGERALSIHYESQGSVQCLSKKLPKS